MTRITCLKCDACFSGEHLPNCKYKGEVLKDHVTIQSITGGVESCHFCNGPYSFSLPGAFCVHDEDCRFDGYVSSEHYIRVVPRQTIGISKTLLMEILKDLGHRRIEKTWPEGDLVSFYDNKEDRFYICTEEVYKSHLEYEEKLKEKNE